MVIIDKFVRINMISPLASSPNHAERTVICNYNTKLKRSLKKLNMCVPIQAKKEKKGTVSQHPIRWVHTADHYTGGRERGEEKVRFQPRSVVVQTVHWAKLQLLHH